jgi:transposase
MQHVVLKQVCGIDVSKDELVVTLGRLTGALEKELYVRTTFANTLIGFASLLTLVKKQTSPDLPVRFTMEATGCYHEELAFFLHDGDQEVSIVLPNKMSAYMRTLETKTITDSTSADAICRFSLERNYDLWQAPKGVYRTMRRLTRERSQIVEERTMVKNELHALEHGHQPLEGSLNRAKARIAFLETQEAEVLKDLKALAKTDKDVQAALVLLCSIVGVGTITALTVLGETAGFDLIRNRRQLTSLAGFDVVEKQSGTSVRGKTRISKRGNRHLRSAMHFPALAAVRHDERFKAIYARIMARHGIKMKGLVAIQRRLLELMYTVFKTQTPYDRQYLQKDKAVIEDRPTQADHKDRLEHQNY